MAAITGAIQGTLGELLYQELGLESLEDSRWSQKLIFFSIKLQMDLSQATLLITKNK